MLIVFFTPHTLSDRRVPQDENEILSNLATEGADMSIMEGDDYMNPKLGMPGPSRLGSSSTAGADMLGSSMHSRHNWDRDLRKFGDMHRLGTVPLNK